MSGETGWTCLCGGSNDKDRKHCRHCGRGKRSTAADARRALLGDDVIRHIHEQVAAAPPAPPETVAALRAVLARPGIPTGAESAAA